MTPTLEALEQKALAWAEAKRAAQRAHRAARAMPTDANVSAINTAQFMAREAHEELLRAASRHALVARIKQREDYYR